MQDQIKIQKLISVTIAEAYTASSDNSIYVRLKKHVENWDEKEYPGKEKAGDQIVQDLQALIAHLEKKGLKNQADEVLRTLVQTFPESHFSALPAQRPATAIDFASLKTRNLNLDSDEKTAEVRFVLNLFEKEYQEAMNDLERFALEIDMKLFREMGTGDAGLLFRHFMAAAKAVSGTELNDAPWALMNQLAQKLNNSLSAFNQAYMLLREIAEVKDAAPSEELAREIEKNEVFFLRNHYWKCIDDAVAKGDNLSVVLYIDKIMPMAQGGHEKSNLLMLRANTVKNSDNPMKGFAIFFIGGLLIMMLLNFLFASQGDGKVSKKQMSRFQEFWNRLTPKTESNHAISFESGQNVLRVLNRAGLDEIKPPDQPTDRKLNIAELRHVVFQRIRLEKLSQQELTPEELEQVNKLWQEWRKRCENYKYEPEDRERAETEAQRNMLSIIDDAEAIKNELASSTAGQQKQNPDQDQDTDDPEPKMEVHKILLSLDTPVHVQKILTRLAEYGYYKGDTHAARWNSQAKKALLQFKLARMAVLDDVWDLKTQEALLGK